MDQFGDILNHWLFFILWQSPGEVLAGPVMDWVEMLGNQDSVYSRSYQGEQESSLPSKLLFIVSSIHPLLTDFQRVKR